MADYSSLVLEKQWSDIWAAVLPALNPCIAWSLAITHITSCHREINHMSATSLRLGCRNYHMALPSTRQALLSQWNNLRAAQRRTYLLKEVWLLRDPRRCAPPGTGRPSTLSCLSICLSILGFPVPGASWLSSEGAERKSEVSLAFLS